MKKVSIIIVNWNGLSHLKKCLPALNKVNCSNYEVIIVDNNSNDGSLEFIKKYYSNFKLIKNNTNLGYTGGNNAGYKKALGEYILFLNNDTYVSKNFVSEMVKVLESENDIAGVQAKILSMDHPRKLDSIGAFLTNSGFLYHYRYLQEDLSKFDNEIYLYTAKGACMLFRKSIIEKVGLFDKDFFAYFEETDFCHRIWLAGYKIKYAPKAVIHHKIGGTANNMDNAFIQYHSFKNRINSYLKNLGTLELLKILPVHLILCELAAFSFIIKGRPDLFVSISRAIIWNLTNLPKTLKKRSIIQNTIRKKPDSELMPVIKKSPAIRYYYYLFAKSLVGYKDNLVIKEKIIH